MRNDEVCHLLRPQAAGWQSLLAEEVVQRLEAEPGRVFDDLTSAFEQTVIERALSLTGGCRLRAANLLGIGRNTITRKIAQLRIGQERPPTPETMAQ